MSIILFGRDIVSDIYYDNYLNIIMNQHRKRKRIVIKYVIFNKSKWR